jgi:hypothetical protein
MIRIDLRAVFVAFAALSKIGWHAEASVDRDSIATPIGKWCNRRATVFDQLFDEVTQGARRFPLAGLPAGINHERLPKLRVNVPGPKLVSERLYTALIIAVFGGVPVRLLWSRFCFGYRPG